MSNSYVKMQIDRWSRSVDAATGRSVLIAEVAGLYCLGLDVEAPNYLQPPLVSQPTNLHRLIEPYGLNLNSSCGTLPGAARDVLRALLGAESDKANKARAIEALEWMLAKLRKD